MAKEWEPKEEHQALITRSIEFISEELVELKRLYTVQINLLLK